MKNLATQKTDYTTEIIEATFDDDVWQEILTPNTDMVLDDLIKLTTDYSCQGCASYS